MGRRRCGSTTVIAAPISEVRPAGAGFRVEAAPAGRRANADGCTGAASTASGVGWNRETFRFRPSQQPELGKVAPPARPGAQPRPDRRRKNGRTKRRGRPAVPRTATRATGGLLGTTDRAGPEQPEDNVPITARRTGSPQGGYRAAPTVARVHPRPSSNVRRFPFSQDGH
jgi:hypothetical protein